MVYEMNDGGCTNIRALCPLDCARLWKRLGQQYNYQGKRGIKKPGRSWQCVDGCCGVGYRLIRGDDF